MARDRAKAHAAMSVDRLPDASRGRHLKFCRGGRDFRRTSKSEAWCFVEMIVSS